MRPFTSARWTLVWGTGASISRCRHWSAMASLMRTPVAARNQKNRCHWSGTRASISANSSRLIAFASSSSVSSAVGRCGRSAEQLSRTSAIQRVDTVNDARLCLGKPLSQSTGEKQVLGGAGTAVLTQHPLHCAITRAAIRQCPYGFNKVEQRGVKCGESVDEPRLERGRLEASTLGANRRVRDPSGSRRQGYALGVACP